MKILSLFFAVATLVTTVAFSQPPGDRDGGRPGRPPRDPFFQLFDTDRNGEISMVEIDNTAAILKKRDRDRNGALTPDELPRPPLPGKERRENFGRNRDPPPRRDIENRQPSARRRAKVPAGTVIFTDGYETDPRDRGRPVALIAAALGVKHDVFRQAFSRVNPASGDDPSPALARANKKALMDALSKHGVTNDRLDTASNYYRYQRGAGEVWRRTAASAKAIIKEGKVTGFRITNRGAGYTTAPTVTVSGYGEVYVKATIGFSKDFKKNGRVKSLTLVESGNN